jgi:hypothetical protein
MYFQTSITLSLLAVCQIVAGHGAIVNAVGDQGGAGMAIGSKFLFSMIAFARSHPTAVDPNTPRDGTRRNPFQQDSTRFRGAAKATCGETLGVNYKIPKKIRTSY